MVTAGFGLTVTVIVVEDPVHPANDVGITIYFTLPEAELLGLVNVWLITEPEEALAPVIPPVMVPIVQAKLPGAEAFRFIFGLVPLQVLLVVELVTIGFGLTVTVIVYGIPEQPFVETGVTIY